MNYICWSKRTALAAGLGLLLIAFTTTLSAQLPQDQQISIIDFSQCANDAPPSTDTGCPGGWINGILNHNNSHYQEDQVVPQRFVWSMPAVDGAPLTGRTVEIRYEARKGAIHAYDSLATWNYTQTTADRCQGLAAADCPSSPLSILSVPDDPTVVNDPQLGDGSATYLHQLAGQVLTMYGGIITDISVPVHDNPTAESSDDYAAVIVTYSVPSLPAKVMLLAGGHTAAEVGPRGWGLGYGSGSVSGGPYHFKWDAADGTAIGRRDNQIMGGAFTCTPPVVSAGPDKVINCDTPLGQVTLTATSDPAGTYLWTTSDGHIVSGANTLSIIVDAAGTYTFTSTIPPDCSTSDDAVVTLDTTPPVVSAGPDAVINCDTPGGQMTLTATSTPAGTYLWTTSNGHIVSGSTTLSVVVDAAGTYTFTSTLANGCEASDSATVTVDTTPPVVSAGDDKVIDCNTAGGQVTLTATSTPAGTYLWTTSDGHIVSGATTLSIVVDAAGTYTFTSTLANGCEASDNATVTVDTTPPVVSAGDDAVINCDTPGGQVTLTATSTPAGTYLWTTSNGHIVSGSTTLSIVVDAAGTYTFTSTLANGCEASDSADVTLDTTPPVVNAGPDAVINCDTPLGQVTLTATSSPAGTYLWTTSNGHIVSGANTLGVVVDAAGTYTFTSTTANGCDASDSATVTVDTTPPVVSAGDDAVINCDTPGGQVTLTATSTPAGSYLWTTSDGHIVSGANTLSVVVDAAGTYTFTSTTANGCDASDSATVTLDTTPPVVNAGPDAVINCDTPEGQVTLTATSTPAGTYLWTTTDGHIVSGANTLSVVVDAAGTYTFTSTTANGCEASDTASVTLDTTPPVVSAGDDAVINCDTPEGQVTLTATSTPAGTYLWTTSDGHIVSGANTLSVIVDAAGTYTFTSTSANGCDASDTASVTLDTTPPVVNAGPDAVITCDTPDGQVTLTATSTPAGTYLWTTSNGHIVSGANTLSVVVDAAGTYTFTSTTANGCDASDSADVTLDTTPPVVSAGDDAVINCDTPDGQVTLTATSTPAGTYLWTTTDGHIVSGANTLSVVVDAAGDYTFTSTLANGCDASDVATVTLDTTPPVVSAGDDAVINCDTPEGQVTLTATSTPAGTYLWTTTDGHIVSGATTLSIVVDAAGTYTFTSTLANGCDASDTASVTLDTTPPVVSAGDDAVIQCDSPDGQITLTATSTPAGTYLWTTSDGHIVSGADTLSVVVDAPGTYTFTSTTTNGCEASDSAVVTVAPCDEYCTLTQGAYGNAGGYHWYNGSLLQTPALLQALLTGSPLVIGLPGRSLSVDMANSQCLLMRLPANGTPTLLPDIGDALLMMSNCDTTPSIINKTGKFKNVLIGQTIALSLNTRLDVSLEQFDLCHSITTRNALPGPDGILGTADDIPDPDPGPDGIYNTADDTTTVIIPQTVLTTLGSNTSVGDLLALANTALGGGSITGTSYSEINMAVDAINRAFDNCRFLVDCSAGASLFSLVAANQSLSSLPVCEAIALSADPLNEIDTPRNGPPRLSEETILNIPREVLDAFDANGLPHNIGGLLGLELRANSNLLLGGYSPTAIEETSRAISKAIDTPNLKWRCAN